MKPLNTPRTDSGYELMKDRGYELIQASLFEVGLTKNGKGTRTWFVSDFDGELPSITHPKVQRAIQINESTTT